MVSLNPKELARQSVRALFAIVLRWRSRPLPFSSGGILVIAPHQDDESLGCGALIASRAVGEKRLDVAFITDGRNSHPNHPRVSPEEMIRLRQREAESALTLLGVAANQVHFFGAPDGSLPTLNAGEKDRLTEEIGRLLNRLRPHQVFLPYRRDGSSEHTAAFHLIRDAVRTSGQPIRLFEYPVWAWWNPRFLVSRVFSGGPVYRIPVDGFAAQKSRAIAAYRSQVEPLAPWAKSALPPEFVASFRSSSEYFFGD